MDMLLSTSIYRSLVRSSIVLVISVCALFNSLILFKGHSDLAQQVDQQYAYLSQLTPTEYVGAKKLYPSITGWQLVDNYGKTIFSKIFPREWQTAITKRELQTGVLFVQHKSILAMVFVELMVANALFLAVVLLNLLFVHHLINTPWRIFMKLEGWANRIRKKGESRFLVKNTDYLLVNIVRDLYQNNLETKHGGNKVEHLIRSQTFLDSATGLGNRIYFEHRLESLLQQEDDAYGAVLIVQFGALDDLDQPSYPMELDDLVLRYANILKQYVDDTQQSVVSRISRSDFAILLPFVDVKEIERVAMNILRMSQKIETPKDYDKNMVCHIGADLFTLRDSSFHILAEADMALRAAQLHGPSGWFVYEKDALPQSDIKGSVRWRTAIENALTHDKFHLYFQPVTDEARRIHHFEVFVRMENDKKELINANVFLPMARKSGLIPEVDKQMLTLLLNSFKENSHHQISVNIHIDSWLNRSFLNWLVRFLKQNRSLIPQIIFEISEFELAANAQKLSSMFAILKRYDARIMVDQVGLYILDTSYMNYLSLDYLKVHQSIVNNIDTRSENQMFVRSLMVITSQKSMKMFAMGVETLDEIRVLQHLGIKGFQGHYIDSPMTQLPRSNVLEKFSGDRQGH